MGATVAPELGRVTDTPPATGCDTNAIAVGPWPTLTCGAVPFFTAGIMDRSSRLAHRMGKENGAQYQRNGAGPENALPFCLLGCTKVQALSTQQMPS